MKKNVSLFLAALLALALIGCGGGKAPQSAPTVAFSSTPKASSVRDSMR